MSKWKLVPVEPTPEMLARLNADVALTARERYDFMLDAAPEPALHQHKKPIVDASGEITGFTDWQDGNGLPWWPKRSLYAAPQQSLDGKLAMGLAVIRELTGTQKTDNIEATIEAVRKAVESQPAPQIAKLRDAAQLVLDDMMFEDLLTFVIETQRYLEGQDDVWASQLLTLAKNRRQEINTR